MGTVDPPHIVPHLTIKPTKPRLCHGARYLNLLMQNHRFSLDRLSDLFRSLTELQHNIATTEALAPNNAWVDAMVDNQAVVFAWSKQGGRSPSLNAAMKQLFSTTTKLNIALHFYYILTADNLADKHSCRVSSMDCQLASGLLCSKNLVERVVIHVIRMPEGF